MDPSGPYDPTSQTSISWAQCQGFLLRIQHLDSEIQKPQHKIWIAGGTDSKFLVENNQESHPRGIHIFLFGFLLICCWGNHISLLVLGHGNLLWMQYIHIYIYLYIYIMNLIYVWIYYITYLNLVCGFNPHHHRIVYDAVKNAILLQAAAPSNYGTWKRQLWKKAINS